MNFKDSCFAFTLFKFGRYKVELWYAPHNYQTVEHTHNNSSGEFYVLYAKNRLIYRIVNKEKQFYIVNFPQCLKKFLSVRAGVPHSFYRGDSCMVWICFEKWNKGSKVTSVGQDFTLTDN